MDVPVLMHKLMEIERALSTRDECAVRNLIIAAQEGVLALERENEELALENAGLWRRLNAARDASLPFAAHSRAFPGCPTPEPSAESFDRKTPSTDDDADTDSGECEVPDDSRPPRTWRITHFFFS